MNKNVKKQIFNISFVVLMVIITIVAVLNSTKELNFTNLKQFFHNCNYLYIIIAFACWGAFVLFEALSLHIILKKLGYKPKITSSIAYSTSDIYYSAITPSATGGQPASAYYMIKDGVSGGVSGFSLIFNLTGYTAAILIIGLFAFVFGFNTFMQFSSFVKILIIFGIGAQVLLLIFFILCMRYDKGVLKFGNFIVGLLAKIKIIKNKQKWLDKVENLVNKYKDCYEEFKKHKKMLMPVLICNVAQRTSQVLISVFVCKSAIECDFFEVFIMQSFIMIGYNSLPLPGGVGAYEYLYMKIYGLSFPQSFVVISMMITRVISYYFSLIVSGIYTMIYHVSKTNRKQIEKNDVYIEHTLKIE